MRNEALARELNDLFDLKTKKDEITLSLKDWDELQNELSELRLQIKNYQGGAVFVYSKMVQLFDTMKNQLDLIKANQEKFKQYIQLELDRIQSEMEKQNKDKEKIITHQVKNLIDQHHQMSKKYSYQMEDLCRSFTMQSEQVWKLSDQVQEIKEGLTHS